jgi:tRNA 2-selenouridine synthase
MPYRIDTLAEFARHGFDTVIDVRSPAEYAEDHLPGAISLPALSRMPSGPRSARSTSRRARSARASWAPRWWRATWPGISTGRFRPAMEGGLAAARLLLAGRPAVGVGRDHPARGRLAGGDDRGRLPELPPCRGARRFYDAPFPARVVLLDGNTGTAKTAVLARLRAMGAQVIDLEGLARHRGSLLGGMGGSPRRRRSRQRSPWRWRRSTRRGRW